MSTLRVARRQELWDQTNSLTILWIIKTAELSTVFLPFQVISLEQPAKYKPIKDLSIGGIVMMKKLGDDPEELVKPVEIKKNLVETEDEPEPPEAFEYTD